MCAVMKDSRMQDKIEVKESEDELSDDDKINNIEDIAPEFITSPKSKYSDRKRKKIELMETVTIA